MSGKSRGHFTLDFWNSYADEAHNATPIWKRKASARANRIPDAYSLFACMQKYDPGTFEDFCGDFGYDTDSRRAEVVYKGVVKEWRKVREFFTDGELEELREIS